MSNFKFDKNQLLEHTNGGLDVIRRLFPECENGSKLVHFKLREENTASVNVFKSEDVYLVKDHGDGTTYNAIDLVMEKESLAFPDACKWVAQEFQFNGASTAAFNRPKLEIIKAKEGQKDGEYYFEFTNFTDKELAVLGPAVTGVVCEEYNLKNCASFTQIKKYTNHKKYGNDTMQIITKATENYPIFVFDFNAWQKIYQPLNVEKQYRFRYVGNKPSDFVFGLDRLPEALMEYQMNYEGEEDVPEKMKDLVIAGGDRDGLNAASLGYPVVWLNSESAKLEYSTYKTLTDFAENIYYVGDLDETGVKETVKLALSFINIKIVWLPQWLKKFSYRGKPKKDLKDYVDHTFDAKDPDKLSREFKALLSTSLAARFWDTSYQKGKPPKYYFNNEACYKFLQYNGFYRFEEDNAKEDFSFVRVNNGVVQRVKHHHLANFPGNYLKEKKKPTTLLNFIHRSAQLSEKSLAKLEQKKIDFKDCSFKHQYLFFENKVWKITKDEITQQNYSDLENVHVWKDKIIPQKATVKKTKAFKITHDGENFDIQILDKKNHFLNYLINTSRVHWRKCGDTPFKLRKNGLNDNNQEAYKKAVASIEKEQEAYRAANRFNIAEEGLTEAEIQEQKEHLINKIFAFGYLLHKQKIDDRAWCVLAMDNRISDVSDSNGGSGKSVMFNVAVRKILLNHKYKPGRDKKLFDNNHVFDGITKDTDYVIFDDLDSHFPFSRIFSEVTGDLSVNPKHGKEYVLPFAQSPKFALTSNFGLFKADASTTRRILYTVFSDYYHYRSDDDEKEHKPGDDFGKQLFSQFDEAEYNDFFNFAAQSVMFYLGQSQKVNPPLDNVEKRNSLQTMGDGFKEWADTYFTEEKRNDLVPKNDAIADFEAKSKLKGWTSQRFKKAIREWCKYYGYVMNPPETVNSQGRCIHNFNGGTVEMIFIKTQVHIENLQEKIKKQNSDNDTDPTDEIAF